MASPHAGQRRCRFTVTDGRESDHLRHVPTVRRRVSQRARGGPRHHDAKFTREVFRSLIKSMAPCSACRVLWLARHTTITPTPRWSGPTAPSAPTPTSPRTVLSSPARRCPCARSTLRSCSCGRLRLSDHLLLVDFAIHNATHRRSATNRRLSLSSAAAHPRLPISPSHQDRTAGESRTARSECNRLRRRRCSLRCGRGGRRSSARAGSTRCSRGATGCCSGPRSCSNIADFGKLRPRRDGPFTPAAGGCAASRATWYGGGGTRHE